jgi:predicted ester cyclase
MPRTDTLLHRWFDEVWNQGREDTIDEMMATDCSGHGLIDENGNKVSNKAEFKRYWRKLRSEFPDIRVEIHDALTDGDRIATRCVVKATHAASGKPIEFAGITIIHSRNGQFIDAWNHYEFHKLQAQLA